MKIQLKKSMVLALTAVTMTQSLSHLLLEEITVQAQTIQANSTEINADALRFIKEHSEDKHALHWHSEIPDLTMTEAQKQELRDFVQKDILGGKEMTDMDKTRLIFTWITKNVHYARGAEVPALNPHEVYKRKVAVCGGYSNLYKALLNAAGVPSFVVFGTIPTNATTATGQTLDPAHQWNAVYADGQWFYSDSTWGERYFNRSVEEISRDHQLNKVQDVTYEDNGIVYGFAQGGLSVENFDAQAERVEIPNESGGRPVVAIATAARAGKSALKTLVLGNNVTRFEPAVFEINQLESIEVGEENPSYESRDGVLFNKGLSSIVYYPNNKKSETFTIPKETATYDPKQTFQNESLKTLLVEEGNQHFASYKGVLYNKELTEILTVPAAADKIVIAGTARLNNHALSFKPSIREVILEEGITEIPENVFLHSDNLHRLTLPKSVTNIDSSAFGGLNLANLTIVGEANTEADRFAKNNNIKFENINATEEDKSDSSSESEEAKPKPDETTEETQPKSEESVPGEAPTTSEKPTVDLSVPKETPTTPEKPTVDLSVPKEAPTTPEKPTVDLSVPGEAPTTPEKPEGTAPVESTETETPTQPEQPKNEGAPETTPTQPEQPKNEGASETETPTQPEQPKNEIPSVAPTMPEKPKVDLSVPGEAPTTPEKSEGTAPVVSEQPENGMSEEESKNESNVPNNAPIQPEQPRVDIANPSDAPTMPEKPEGGARVPDTAPTTEEKPVFTVTPASPKGENLSPLPNKTEGVSSSKVTTEKVDDTKKSEETHSSVSVKAPMESKEQLPATGEQTNWLLATMASITAALGFGVNKVLKNKRHN